MRKPFVRLWIVASVAATVGFTAVEEAFGQPSPTQRGTENVEVVSHIPLGAWRTTADIEIEQEMSRPYVYVARRFDEAGIDIIDISDPGEASVILRWRFDNMELRRGTGPMDPKYFKHDGRYYLVQGVQFSSDGIDHDLGAVVFDVTDLPDTRKVKVVAEIREPENPGGFHNIFMYKHSNGAPLLFTTVRGPFANVYDMAILLKEGPENARIARIPVPENTEPGNRGYHDMYVAFDPATGQDKYYGGGAGGYYVFDISSVGEPKLIASITGVPGVRWGHTFTPTPDGRYAVGETEYQYAPLRIYDLKPALDGEVPTIRLPIGAWTANWENLTHNHEVRWPYVFVSGYEDGLQIFNMQDPTRPFTVGYYDTYLGPHKRGGCSDRICNGAFGVDVRNADGLIVVSDGVSGFWSFRMEGFSGWQGKGWGMPNISSAQDWDDGPEGAEKSVTLRESKSDVAGSR